MGSSFKLQKGGNAKEQAKSIGILLIIMSIVVFFLIDLVFALILGGLGVVLVLGSLGASE